MICGILFSIIFGKMRNEEGGKLKDYRCFYLIYLVLLKEQKLLPNRAKHWR